ncbi:phosphoglycerate kinase [Methylopila jiangsuensis]|uniref:Phosphoglycerate kinase n=1 Tax=Methylopila jiangsuensis TaxID=586230 RepID=A0A9W6JGK3_9HYPH|nr:phosphoglycerate kinase [Methylopila jiangsuensis]MDR6286441.1 phosphoglycerate kinase [Methylopila jiangsuensis]GLK77221.1 phosphoglycerate kinase [Methylopila jiangsuensis]
MTTAFKTLDDVDVAGKRVLVRVDLNVPMDGDRVTDDTRLRAIAPTLRELAQKGARTILLAHFGRPKGKRDESQSLKVVVPALEKTLMQDVGFADDCVGETAAAAIARMTPGDVLLLENARFHPGEEKNDPAFAAELARLGDLYVNDAFSAAHRAHASTEGLARLLPAYAGRSMQAELDALSKALGNPERPVVAVVGGAKVSTKLDLLGNLVGKVDHLVIAGGMANTFLFAEGVDIGKSLCEKDLADTAREIVAKARAAGCAIVLPSDGRLAKEFKAGAENRVAPVGAVAADEMILDVGPDAIAKVSAVLEGAKTLVWNGPFGAFEIAPFDQGTVAIARKAAELTRAGKLLSVAGGGDTVAALNHAGVAGDFTYVSTAGGAFLEWLEGKELPGVAALSATS